MTISNLTSITPQGMNAPQTGPPALKEGQMFHGQVKQLYPGQMAEVQIGGQKLVAKLEVPMKAGDSYYFQVKAVEPELQLKIISGPTQASEGTSKQLAGLMDAMQLPKTTEMQALLNFVVQNKIPMSRENLIEAANLLKNVPIAMRGEALQSIQKLMELKLPLNENLFRSLLGVEAREGMHSNLTALKNALMLDLALTHQLKSSVLTTLENVSKPFTQATSNAVLGQAFLTLLDQGEQPENRFSALQLLKDAGLLPQKTSLANLQQVLQTVLQSNAEGLPKMPLQNGQVNQQPAQQLMELIRQMTTNLTTQTAIPFENLKAAIQSDLQMNTQQKNELMAIVNRASQAPQTNETLTKLTGELNQALLRQAAQQVVASPFQHTATTESSTERLLSLIGQQQSGQMTNLMKIAESSGNVAVQKMVEAAETLVSVAIDGRAMKDALQSVFRGLGVNYEAALLGRDTDIGRLSESLKPQLLEILQQQVISPGLREATENVVMRMNGPLLQSGENGLQHQLVMQVPLEFFGKRVDTTLEWNGRMKADGKIDPDYARILFYLDLASLKETVIDMQVQNRVVSITVFNADDSLKNIGSALQKSLKEGLELSEYKLSGVFFKTFEKEEQKVVKKELSQSVEGKGVDFRI